MQNTNRKFDRVLLIKCLMCRKEYQIPCFLEDAKSYKAGEKIQDCFPYLSAGDRELLISQVCNDCFDSAFGGEAL